jgi:predicted outer membrane repeat protein
MNINKCKITKNKAWEGGGIYNSGSLDINNSLIMGNSANSEGGGIYCERSRLNINNSQILYNEADEFFLRDYFRIFEGADGSSSWWSEKEGGGIYRSDGRLVVNNSVIHGNRAGQRGGGIYSHYSLYIYNSIISDNWSWKEGGGIWCRESNVVNTTISGNVACLRGGGIYGAANLDFVKVYSNFAPRSGGITPDVQYDSRSEIKGNLLTNM